MRNPESAGNLSELCEILNKWAEVIAYDDSIADYDCDLTSLPTFGGPEVSDTTEVWSWDADSLLVNEPQITVAISGWEIQPRCTVCGEATFHCEHDI